MEEARIVLSTTSSREEAQRIARTLVEERLAACVNLVENVTSIYRWQGAVEESLEIMLIIKCNVEKLAAIETRLHQMHSYDVPEFLVLPVEGGSSAYLRWLRESSQ
ncbi:divalent-cation tolerance protein CutA [Pseudacidobacterium ailaaui]|jgi:periplasmic divalent cation tolerance protein|uniref:divalent-cation tolerance protein CutA n=1 Tax=Pseudacidobacterium ailaaui TaxID=1382359 RepID=UPI00047B3FDC|nr:divalent-cation tolerance protein CutA [Pseudacidobacterium ailaaui]MCL6464619.1 divalent-cation tolerance protein CutA [Pseudacidobacterium ailaaui]MDI3254172.1 divalent-cation tolerance protein CutA [Bacillota bacterium]